MSGGGQVTCQPIHTLYEGKCVRGRDTKIVFCSTCGYAHIFPKPTEDDLVKYYQGAYYTQEKPAYGADQDRLGEYLDVVNQEKLLALGLVTESIPFVRGSAVDVGCGRETRWMKALQGAGTTCAGVDPCVYDGPEEINGFKVFSSLGKWRGPVYEDWNPASIISLNFVLEHVVDPRSVLLKCRGYMSCGGQLLVEVPNDFTDRQRGICRPGETPWWVSTPDHVNYFNHGSLENLLHSCGFHVEITRSTWPVESLLAGGHDYRTDPEAKKLAVSCRAERQRRWWAMGLSASKSGRTVWCVARKV